MQEYNIIADVAGEFDALMRLIGKMPKDAKIILLGDLVDRGRQNAEVVDWAIENEENVITLMGNHEHMMVDYFYGNNIYERGLWLMNGGDWTNNQYIDNPEKFEKHVKWLQERPLIHTETDFIASHGVWDKDLLLDEAKTADTFDEAVKSVLWCRNMPIKRDKFQISGHNSHWGLTWFEDYAVCLDDSQQQKVTGIHWPSKEIYQEEY